ncbi:4-hydroxy-3-methylbut-2-enyl diphosphate reductase [Desulfitispora alkaliphila]|uniref:bifunctional 4-hydroxy-3-methylbut-2-enyl diphosphate reductase/30S ribosomal protein S1 n=1 Tax=Desulfitispora alkaliphila TaxID=622674 RepID=UPI003D1C86A6
MVLVFIEEEWFIIRVILAKSAGFCFGVERAMKIAEDASEKGKKKLFTYGPIIHNPQAVERLEKKNVKPLDNLDSAENQRLIIRSHGVAPEVMDQASKLNIEIYDATCPFVQKAQRLAQKYGEEQYKVAILGDERHPEVQGIYGWAGSNAFIVENPQQAEKLPNMDKVALIAQTTQTAENFNQVVEILRGKCKTLEICNTICDATKQRQEAAVELAKQVDVMLVVGGKNSSNTKKLAQICKNSGSTTYHIEDAKELKKYWFHGAQTVGITAGASTPGWILEEVAEKMNEMETNLKELTRGDIITGKVVQVTENDVMVDVGGKSEGIIPKTEVSLKNVDDPSTEVAVGDEIQVYIIKVENEEGNPILSKKRADRKLAWDKVEQLFEEKSVVETEALSVVKGGILVDLGIKGFLPASLVDRGYVDNLEQFVGQKLQVKIIEFDKENNKVVVSRKVLLDEEHEKAKEKTWEALEEGQVKKGTVQRITDFGAFVDLGGVDGLLHVSELSWGRVDHPKEVLSEGQELDVFVIKVDQDKGKVSLGLKQLKDNPWNSVADKYKEGSVLTGKVMRLAPFGAFVELEPGVEGLVHISQISQEHIGTPDEALEVGQEVKVKVLGVDEKEQRISLSIKEAVESKKSDEVKTYMDNQDNKDGETGVTLGDLFGDILKEAKKDDKK